MLFNIFKDSLNYLLSENEILDFFSLEIVYLSMRIYGDEIRLRIGERRVILK